MIDSLAEEHSEQRAERAVELVRRWLGDSGAAERGSRGRQLAGVLADPTGPAFTRGFVDGVVRPEDLGVAARNLHALGGIVPGSLPWHLSAAVRLGAVVAPVLPWPVVPMARRVLRAMVSHLVIDARPAKLGNTLAALDDDGIRLNLNLLGESVLGEDEALRRLQGITSLVERDDVDYVSVKVSSIASGLSMWSFEHEVDRVVERLLPLYLLAAANETFINLDMEEYRDLDLTMAVFMRLLDEPELAGYEAGIVLQAYLPDAYAAMDRLHEWSSSRVGAGGAPIKVRVVKGANLAMERVDAELHGWPHATWGSKRETDTAYLRLLDRALTPERTSAVRVGIAGHNLFDLAWAWLLAEERGVTDQVDVEMLLGMTGGGAEAVRRHIGRVLLYTPVVDPGEFDAAIAYLVRRLEENTSDENFMSVMFDLADDAAAFERERHRFMLSLAGLADPTAAGPRRVQDRQRQKARASHGAEFDNEPDTDPSSAANRAWAAEILQRAPTTTLGDSVLKASLIDDRGILDRVVETVARTAETWAARPADERARLLERAAATLHALRADLLECAATETGKTLAEGDPEVSEAVDFARYYATLARQLDEVTDATYRADRVTVVAPPWNFPISIAAGSVLAALAAGSGVIFKPAPQARRTGAVVADALWQAGIPRELLAFVDIDEQDLGRVLIEHPLIDRVLLTGAWETAELFRSWRPGLRVNAETSGKNAIVVTPSADLDLAAADVVKSAFGHAGQKCSAASLVILVGSVGRSERFLRQVVDATRSLRVGEATHSATQMGPLIEPASGKLLHALSTLGAGETWLVEPRRLDDAGRLWTPGIRDGVEAGSEFHQTEYFGPVLGIMRASTIEEAIELQNAVPYGLTAGLHSLDHEEIDYWLDTVQAGNLYLNKGITGAIVQRQPFGGWKRSSVGGGGKAGGPNQLLGLVHWSPLPVEPGVDIALTGVGDAVTALIEAATSDLPYEGFEFVRHAARSDEEAWQTEFGVSKDVAGLVVERNVFRYRPASVVLRRSEVGSTSELVRLIAAALRCDSPTVVSTATPLSSALIAHLARLEIEVSLEDDTQFEGRVARGELSGTRLRLSGGTAEQFLAVADGDPSLTVYDGEVTAAGRVELLPFLLEQSISASAHRYGTPIDIAAVL